MHPDKLGTCGSEYESGHCKLTVFKLVGLEVACGDSATFLWVVAMFVEVLAHRLMV